MGRLSRVLTAAEVKSIQTKGLHYVGGVKNLALLVSKSGTRSWILRIMVDGKRRDLGLGPYPEVPLAEARERGFRRRSELLSQSYWGLAAPVQPPALPKRSIIFSEACERYIDSHSIGWKNQKHEWQWRQTLTTYAYPIIGSIQARDVTLDQIIEILEPIWTVKCETASRLRGRIELVLAWCITRGYREGTNPAAWKGNLETILPAKSRVAKVTHHIALEWEKCPRFYADLHHRQGTSSEALKLVMLTACRSIEVRGARWSEIDLAKKVWTIPKERMKKGREHRVPLSEEAMRLIDNQPRFVNCDLLFPNSRGSMLSDMALLAQVRRMGEKITVHGFRSSFRDWAGETTNFSREVIEQAMAHQLPDKAEAAYARGDLFQKRVALMSEWEGFLAAKIGGSPPPSRVY